MSHIPPFPSPAPRTTGITATEGADGYVCFFTGSDTIAGDNDFFYDRETGDLKLGGAGKLVLPLAVSGIPTLTWGTTSDGIGMAVDGTIQFNFNNVSKYSMTTAGFTSGSSFGASVVGGVNASDTNVTLAPNKADLDTGLGSAAADQLSLIAGAIEGINITEATGTVITTIKGPLKLTANSWVTDNSRLDFGEGLDFRMQWSTGQTNDAMQMGMGDSRTLLLCSGGAMGLNFAHAIQSNPTIFGHSSTQPTTSTDEWWSLAHIKSACVLATGKGGISLRPENAIIDAYGDLRVQNGSQLLIGTGTQAAPQIAFQAATNWGLLYTPGQLDIVAGGGTRVRFTTISADIFVPLDMNSAHLFDSGELLNLGAGLATSHSLGTGHVGVANNLEVDGTLFADGRIEAASVVSIIEQTQPDAVDGYSILWSEPDEQSSLMLTDGYSGPGVTVHYLRPHYAEMYVVSSSASEAFGNGVYGKLVGVTNSGIVNGNFLVGSGNRIIWNGKHAVDIHVSANISFTTNGTTEKATMVIALNDVVEEKTGMERYAQTGSDTGAVAISGIIHMEQNDYVEIWGKLDSGSAIWATKIHVTAVTL